MKDFSTLCELILFQADKFNNPRALAFKKNQQLKTFSNQQLLEKSFHFACGLKEIGLQKGQTCGIFSYQNPIWMIVNLGTILAGGISVPIFSNISEENLFFEIEDAELQYFFTDNAAFVQKKLPLQKIITHGLANEKRSDLLSFEELILLGKKSAEEGKYNLNKLVKAAKAEDLATIIYTSGSTGKPKGVEITHANLVAQIHDAQKFFPLSKNDVALSFLPLAHIFEGMVSLFYLSQGVSIHFIDDIKKLGISLREIEPSLITTVPRMLEKVFLRIKDKVEHSSFIQKAIAQKAIERALNKDPLLKKKFSDKVFELLVYKKFRDALGKRMRMIICGGSALSLEMQRFFENIGIRIFCGYGLTETSPVLAANCPEFYKIGTVGKSFPSVSLKISGDKELLARGPNVMHGYHNDKAKTKESFIDGWFKTGDLAEIDDEGFVKIIGRKKELFKSANGKYIAPVPIEQRLERDLEFLAGAIIIAENRKFTSALLFTEFEILTKFKRKFDAEKIDDEEFLKSKKLQNFVAEKIAKINEGLDNWQRIKKFYIATEPISIESGDITPSMKLKRKTLEEKYQKVIDAFYRE